MKKLFFMLFLVTAFGFFLFSCQNSMNPSESPEMSAIESQINAEETTLEPECEPGQCAATPGYWKNHPEAWPVDEITIGGVTYSQEDALNILMRSVKGDKTITLAKALIAAKLNVLRGAESSCIAETIAAADAWLASYGLGSGVKGKDGWTCEGEELYLKLDCYNNGGLCAPGCD